jgi:hypothetical protein
MKSVRHRKWGTVARAKQPAAQRMATVGKLPEGGDVKVAKWGDDLAKERDAFLAKKRRSS